MRARGLTLALMLAGCGDDDATIEDAGHDAEEDGAIDAAEDAPVEIVIAPPAAPMPAAQPDQRPCPAGWIDEERDGAFLCRAVAGDALHCEGATAQFPGASACVQVGSACPSGDLPEAPEGAVYVLAGSVDGDGTRERPFATIAEGLAAAPEGGTVAIGRGEYREAIEVLRDVSLVGACAGETRIVFESTFPYASTVSALGEFDVSIRDLTVHAVTGVAVDGRGSTVRLRGVEIRADEGSGFAINEGALEAHDVVARATEVNGVYDAQVELERFAAYDTGTGLSFFGATGTGRAITIVETVHVAGNSRNGISVAGGCDLDLREMLVDVRSIAFNAQASSTVVLEHVDVRRPSIGLGIGGSVVASSVVLLGVGNESFGISVSGSGDATFRDLYLAPDPVSGLGASVSQGVLRLDRAAIVRPWGLALAVDEEGTLVVTDVTVIDAGRSSGSSALSIVYGSTATVDRLAIRGGEGIGVIVQQSTAQIVDLSIAAAEDQRLFAGIVVEDGSLELERAQLTATRGAALAAIRSQIEGHDVRVADARPDDDGTFGRGIEADDHATVTLERLAIEHTLDHAVLASASDITLGDVSIRDVSARACVTSTCPSDPYGIGVGAYGGHVTLERFELREASLCGVYLGGGRVELREGVVRDGAVGVCLGTDDYDLGDLTTGVSFVDLGTTLDARRLPVPETIPPLEAE